MGRAPCCEKVGLKKGKWTAEEDEILVKYIQAHGEGSWRSLPKNAGLLRCGKSCRLRWMNYLRADVKRGNISAEEEETIIKLHGTLGNRWSLIAGHLPGRTDNEIKNYWNSHLSRRIHIFKRKTDDGGPVIMDIGRIGGRTKRRGGKVKRSPTNIVVVEAENNSQQMAAASHHEEAPSNTTLSEEEGREGLFSGPREGPGCGGATSNIQEPDQCLFCPNDDGTDSWLVGLNELIEGGCSSNEETENCWLATGESDGWSSSMAHGLDSVGCLQDQWLHWEWEEMEGQMLINDGGRETRAAPFGLMEYDNEEQLSSSWLWDNDLEELQVGRKAHVF